jgi:FkbM family methyltransferase
MGYRAATVRERTVRSLTLAALYGSATPLCMGLFFHCLNCRLCYPVLALKHEKHYKASPMKKMNFENRTGYIVAAILPLLLAAIILAGVACQKKEEASACPVSQEVLVPRLLQDQQEMNDYMGAFPISEYKQYNVSGLGAFYVDKPSDMIKGIIISGRVWENRIDDLLKKYIQRGSIALDIGAHIGTHTLRMAQKVGPKGNVYAFEPQKKIYRELVYNLNLNHVANTIPLRYAVGNANAVIEMDAAQEGNEGATAIGRGGDKAELRTIDSFSFQGISLVKIDVEGFEDPVIDGARETLLKNHPVIIVEIRAKNPSDASEEAAKARIANSKKKIENLGYGVESIGDEDYLALPRK